MITASSSRGTDRLASKSTSGPSRKTPPSGPLARSRAWETPLSSASGSRASLTCTPTSSTRRTRDGQRDQEDEAHRREHRGGVRGRRPREREPGLGRDEGPAAGAGGRG